jgi:hypothetical protein
MLRFLEQTAEAGLQLSIGIGLGKEALGELPRPFELSRRQSRSYGTSTSESTLGIRCGQKLSDLLLEERDIQIRRVHAWSAKVLESLGAPDRLRDERVKKIEAHGSP